MLNLKQVKRISCDVTSLQRILRQLRSPFLLRLCRCRVFIFAPSSLHPRHVFPNHLGRQSMNDFYSTKAHMLFSIFSVLVYVFLVLINLGYIMCDMSPDWFVFGYPLQFPYLNFPLALFLIHQFILNTHKQMPYMVYEITEEDIFAYVLRAKCLNWADCHYATQIQPLLVRPSTCNFVDRGEIGQRVKQIHGFGELDPWLADKFRCVLLPTRHTAPVVYCNY
ncbi:hypothetical protein L596_025943 [Steinernema carpocapsae]|uniref:Uncharacterized protein n=1 Tax=Steinernema carpocapsae TaxID=34508 RepID=A0A4U5M9C1_STECR|nr:hypothetical protein L596_025943 [Steinernema carpocapsae]